MAHQRLDAANFGWSLTLECGHAIELQEIHQARTYAGMLEEIKTYIEQDIADAVGTDQRLLGPMHRRLASLPSF